MPQESVIRDSTVVPYKFSSVKGGRRLKSLRTAIDDSASIN